MPAKIIDPLIISNQVNLRPEASTTSIDYSFFTHPIVITMIVLRILAALYIFLSPLWGFIWSLILDTIDGPIVIFGAKLKRYEYHVWDKYIDLITYVAELWISTRYGLFLPFFLLFFYRFLGSYMFIRNHEEVMYVLFPNLFEAAFAWLVIFYPHPVPVDIYHISSWHWLGAFLILKLMWETSLHYVWPKLKLPHIEDQLAWIWDHVERT